MDSFRNNFSKTLGCALILLLNKSLFSSGATVTQVTQPVDHGEGPAWDERTGLLYFVDMFNGKLNRYDMESDEVTSMTMNGDLTLVIPCESDENQFIISLNQTLLRIQWDGQNSYNISEVLAVVDIDKPNNRFNDGKADKEGRLWVGTMGLEERGEIIDVNYGSLYLVTNETVEKPQAVIHPVNISNGMAWNQANDKFYYIDTTADQVTEYDYNKNTGSISNRRVVFDVNNFSDEITGHPDGMTIDNDGKLWIALYGGGAVVQFDPQEMEITQIVSIPATYTTSVCWGGDNYDILFVTTSRFLLTDEERENEPAAGSVFTVTDLGVQGVPTYRSKIIKA